MKPDFKIGDYVGLLDGTEKGYVIRITSTKACFETNDGFEITVAFKQLVKYVKEKKKKNELKSSDKIIDTDPSLQTPKAVLKHDSGFESKKRIKKVKDPNFKINPAQLGEEKKIRSVKHQDNIWEVDLHIEEIVDDYKYLTNGEIVDLQLRHAKSVLEKARRNKISKLIFIHGKGKGTLRNELLHLLSGYTNLEFYDASFKIYGGGATEVRLYLGKS